MPVPAAARPAAPGKRAVAPVGGSRAAAPANDGEEEA
jgi:hypothetical protein